MTPPPITQDTAPQAGLEKDLVSRLAASLSTGTRLDLECQSIPAALLRAVLLGRSPNTGQPIVIPLEDIDPHGLDLANTTITGHLDLANTHVTVPISMTRSEIPLGLTLRGAHLDHHLHLTLSTMPTLDLAEARIAGQLNLSGAKLTGIDRDRNSLIGDNLQVDGAAFLNDGFTATGGIRLHGAHVGQLNLSGAKLTGIDRDGNSLIGDDVLRAMTSAARDDPAQNEPHRDGEQGIGRSAHRTLRQPSRPRKAFRERRFHRHPRTARLVQLIYLLERGTHCAKWLPNDSHYTAIFPA